MQTPNRHLTQYRESVKLYAAECEQSPRVKQETKNMALMLMEKHSPENPDLDPDDALAARDKM